MMHFQCAVFYLKWLNLLYRGSYSDMVVCTLLQCYFSYEFSSSNFTYSYTSHFDILLKCLVIVRIV